MSAVELASTAKTEVNDSQIDICEEKQSESDTGEILDTDESDVEDISNERNCIPITRDNKLNDLNCRSIDREDGEISDDNYTEEKSKSICRFFKRGACIYGSGCHYRHISDQIYSMFERVTPSNRNINVIDPVLYSRPPVAPPCPFEHGQGIESSWETALEKAKIMVQRAISKREDDEEFETKKLFLSSKNVKCDVSGENPVLARNKFPLTHNLKSFGSNSPKQINKRNNEKTDNETVLECDSYRKSNFHCKWVDPWMRSRSPRKNSRSFSVSPSPLRSRKDYHHSSSSLSSSSSTSTFEGTKGSPIGSRAGSKKCKTKRRKHFCSRSPSPFRSRSYSRKRFRSRSFSRSSSSSSNSHKNIVKRFYSDKSPDVVLPYSRKNTRREELSKSPERRGRRPSPCMSRSRSSSCSSFHKRSESVSRTGISPRRHSGGESSSSMTVSSRTCSTCSSCDSSRSQIDTNISSKRSISTHIQHKFQKLVQQPEVQFKYQDPVINTVPSSKHNIQKYSTPAKERSTQPERYDPSHREEIKASSRCYQAISPAKHNPSVSPKRKGTLFKSGNTTSERDGHELMRKNVGKHSIHTNTKDTDTFSRKTSDHTFVPKTATGATKKTEANSTSTLVASLLRYRGISTDNSGRNENAAKPNGRVATLRVSKPDQLKTNSESETKIPKNETINNSLTSDNRTKVGSSYKRIITLNLQPKSQKLIKQPEVQFKYQDAVVNKPNNETRTLNRREVLLKQLKLVEDAIARKKQ